MLLSVLIPSIPRRIERMAKLFSKLERQISDNIAGAEVEILSFLDNKKRSVGLKRDGLVRLARGKYLTFVDDDDDVYDNYLKSILGVIRGTKTQDVVVFNEHVQINGGNIFTVRFGIEYDNQEARKVNGRWIDITRKPFHSCVWRTEIAVQEHFADASYGEDWHWCKRLLPRVVHQARINDVLSKYTFDSNVTEAEYVFPKGEV